MSDKLPRVAWRQNSAPLALLQRINEATEPNENGSISFVMSDHSELLELLAHQVFFPTDVNHHDASSLASRAFLELRREGEVQQKPLISLISKRVKQWRDLPSKTFTMWTKLRLSQMAFAKSSRFEFDSVRVRTVARLPKWLMLEDHFISGVGHVKPNALPFFGYLILTANARTENEASERFFAALDKFYAVVNTSWRARELAVSHRPSSVLLHGPNYFIFENTKFLGKDRVWWSQEFDETEWKSFPKKAKDFQKRTPVFRKVIRNLDTHPLRVPLERTLILISEGMMSSRLSFRLMRFWSAAEALYTEDGSKTTYDRLIQRMLFSQKEMDLSVERLKLQRACELRNQYVHKGATEREKSSLIDNLRETILYVAYYLIFNGRDFGSHSEFLEIIEPSNAPHKVSNRLIAIERRKKIVETGRHKD